MDELKIGTPLDAFDYIVFFKGLKRMKVNISLFDLDHFTGFETPISDKWLDFTVVHTFAQNVASKRGMYLLLNAQASRLLQNEAQNEGGTMWWGKKYFKHNSTFNNIVIVPYLDKDHWSLYILEEEQTIHYDFILGFHNNTTSKEFAHDVCISWDLFSGLNEDDTKFATFMNVDTVVPKVFAQKNSWECGH
jgi:hypothetical protein